MSKKDYPPKNIRTAENIEKEIAEQQNIIIEANEQKEANEKVAEPLRRKIDKTKLQGDLPKKIIKKNKTSENNFHTGDVLELSVEKGGEIKKINNSEGENGTGKKLEEPPIEKENVLNEIKKDLNETFQTQEEKRVDGLIYEKLKTVGLTPDDFKDNKEWDFLSNGEKLLIIEQLSQETLSHVKEIGEQKFQEKNKINLSWKPTKWNPLSLSNKLKNHLGKAYWISREEKQALKEAESGKIKPSEELIKQMIERTSDMHLNVSEKEGRAVIEFISIDKNLPEEQQKIIREYNEVANEFARMPDSWRNEKAANSKDTRFHRKNYENFEKVKLLYENTKSNLLKIKKDQYEKSGLKDKEATGRAMLDVKDKDFQIAILQFINTNPDVTKELNRIKKESSIGRLFNNENIWRTIYMGAGFGARSITVSTFGLLAAPIVAGAIGGIRARKKAREKINLAFSEGRKIETLKERKESGKIGLFDDKDKNRNLISKTLSGYNVSAKEVGAFVDADSQIQRIDNLIKKIDSAKTDKEKLLLKNQLGARIDYIENKNDEGLINYGTKNSLVLNYELFKKLSEAEIQLEKFNLINDRQAKKIEKRRDTFLEKIMTANETGFDKKQAGFKNQEMLRGAVVAGGFSLLGWKIRDWISGGEEEIVNNLDNEFNNPLGRTLPGQEELNPIEEKIIEHASVEATADSGQGAISTIRELQNNLQAEYEKDLEINPSGVPESIKHIINTDANKLAEEYGMYKPGEDAESVLIKSGAFFKVEEDGDVTFHESANSSGIRIQEGTSIKADQMYEGRMVDTDNSGVKIENTENIPNGREPIEIPHIKGKFDAQISTEEIIPNETTPETIDLDNPEFETRPSNIINQEPISIPKAPVENDQEIISGKSDVKAIKPEDVEGKKIISGESEIKYVDIKKDEEIELELEQEIKLQVDSTYDENIKHLFPTDKELMAWEKIKNSHSTNAGVLAKMKEGEVSDVYKPIVSYIHNLQIKTGLTPIAESELRQAETSEEFIKRALSKLALLGRLDEVKL